jgi:hypothetical protein
MFVDRSRAIFTSPWGDSRGRDETRVLLTSNTSGLLREGCSSGAQVTLVRVLCDAPASQATRTRDL